MARAVVYFSEEDLLPLFTNRDLVDALDDDGDGEADAAVIEQVIDIACDEIDEAYVMRGIDVPLDITLEKAAPRWGKYLFVAHAYGRRQMPPERSGHGAMIKTVRDLLAKIAGGRMDVPSLTAAPTGGGNSAGGTDLPGEGAVVDVVSEEMLTVPRRHQVLS